jgi:hypothetical protein
VVGQQVSVAFEERNVVLAGPKGVKGHALTG